MTAAEIAEALGGHRSGSGWDALCPAHDDHTPSLSLVDRAGRVLVRCHAGCTQVAVIEALRARGLWPAPTDTPTPKRDTVPRRTPDATWTYHDASGAEVRRTCRWDTAAGKVIRPRVPDGRGGWRSGDMDGLRPLYRLPELLARPGAPVLVTEGEACADAAQAALPDYVCVTSAGGSQAAGRTDWTPLRGRTVIAWPDADAPGEDYARDVVRLARAAGATDVRTVRVPDTQIGGWDVVDALAAGWTPDGLRALIDAARHEPDADAELAAVPVGDEDDDTPGGPRRKSTATRLVELLTEHGDELWTDREGQAYATCRLPSGARATYRVRSRDYRLHVARLYYLAERRAPTGDALVSALGLAEAMARYDGAQHAVHVRVGEHDGAIYLDLGDPTWRAVAVTPAGWRIVDDPPVRFRRARGMLALPEPVRGGRVDDLRALANIGDDATWRLVRGWLTAALRPRGPYPLLAVHGEQGAAKSTVCRLLRGIVDPAVAALRAEPRDVRDLLIAATNGWVVALDNVSHLPPWLSDALCRLATGGGFGARELYTDGDETLWDATRPTMANGITEVATRGDLLDRALLIELARIPETHRRTETELAREYDRVRPGVLGALLDDVGAALRHVDTVRLASLPRMADYAVWCVAADPAGGDAFLKAYAANRRTAQDTALDADVIARHVLAVVPDEGWTGTAGALLTRLVEHVDDATRRQRGWPATPRALAGALRRCAPALRSAGVSVAYRAGGTRGKQRIMDLTRESDGATVGTVGTVGTRSDPRDIPRGYGGEGTADGRATVGADRRHTVGTAAPHGSRRADGADGADGTAGLLSAGPTGRKPRTEVLV